MNSQLAVNTTLRDKINTAAVAGPVEHRFLPSEKPRSVNTAKTTEQKLAGEVGFQPVATISVTNTDTYVRPVKNTHQRPMSSAVVSKAGQVSIKGEKFIELSSNLHEQIKAKVGQGTVYQKETLVAPPQPPVQRATEPLQPRPLIEPVQTPEQAKARGEELKKQLESINKVLFEQIRQKISSEITRQKTQPVTAPTNEPKTPAFRQPKVVATAAVATVQKPESTAPIKAPVPQIVTTKPSVIAPIKPPQQVPIQPSKIEPPKKQVLEPVTLSSHIENLEKEIETLSKEVLHIDQTISNLEKEHSLQELSALEQNLAYDEKMMQAVSNWKGTLTNLVNSHSIALKYLKQKTDWLSDKVENIEGHREKHERMHRKPRELNFKLQSLEKPKELVSKPELPAEAKPVIGTVNLVPVKPDEAQPTSSPLGIATVIQEQAPTEIKVNVPQETVTANTAVIQSTVTQPPEIKEVVRKEEAQPEQVKAAVEKALLEKTDELRPKVIEKETVKEVQNLDTDKVQTLIQNALEKQNEQAKPSTQEIEKLVSEALKKQVPSNTTQPAPTILSKAEAKTVEIPANVSIGQPKVLPGNPEAQINIKAIPVQTGSGTSGQLPTIVTGAELSLQEDVEKQILESAAKEEAAKEAVRQAKEELLQKKKEEEEKQKQPQQKDNQVQEKPTLVTPEALKEDLTQIKNSLAAVDLNSMAHLSKDDRSQMKQQLETLEHQNEVSRQFDEIKAATERRRINAEIQAMLEKLGKKPAAEVTPTQKATTEASIPTNSVEALKIQEKKEKSPEEKARIIAEIKGLERQREARKLEERSRPVVKAMPAYGKMLPNTPTVPNVINGIVKSNKGLLMDTVVIIVKDQSGDPVRAFKTNKIGQFALSTPLPNGVYTLELEKEGFDFDIIEVEVNGGILSPIEIKAR